jgi:hypothetical protein
MAGLYNELNEIGEVFMRVTTALAQKANDITDVGTNELIDKIIKDEESKHED